MWYEYLCTCVWSHDELEGVSLSRGTYVVEWDDCVEVSQYLV